MCLFYIYTLLIFGSSNVVRDTVYIFFVIYSLCSNRRSWQRSIYKVIMRLGVILRSFVKKQSSFLTLLDGELR